LLNKKLVAELGLDEIMCRFMQRLEAYNGRTGSAKMKQAQANWSRLAQFCREAGATGNGTTREATDE
jgi:hypothetical protein